MTFILFFLSIFKVVPVCPPSSSILGSNLGSDKQLDDFDYCKQADTTFEFTSIPLWTKLYWFKLTFTLKCNKRSSSSSPPEESLPQRPLLGRQLLIVAASLTSRRPYLLLAIFGLKLVTPNIDINQIFMSIQQNIQCVIVPINPLRCIICQVVVVVVVVWSCSLELFTE